MRNDTGAGAEGMCQGEGVDWEGVDVANAKLRTCREDRLTMYRCAQAVACHHISATFTLRIVQVRYVPRK